jgi:uncharacterized protein (DUF488 family)
MSTALRPVLYTVGHSTRPSEEMIEILEAVAVTCLVDVRGIPRSRTNPQYNIDMLPRTLDDAHIDYVHLPALGGRRSRSRTVDERANSGWTQRSFHNYADYAITPPFRDGLDHLLRLTMQRTCAIMCAEAVWWRCHRRIISDHVLAHGIRVVHLLTASRREPAAMTSFAIIGGDARASYPGAESRKHHS